jgi:hypothetical protein
MPDQRKPLFSPPQPAGKVSLPNEGPAPAFDRFLQGLLGDQLPGDTASMLGAALPLLPLGKLLKALKGGKLVNEITPAANVGDQMLREHLVGSPRMREFLPVGEEGAAMKATNGSTGPDAIEEAYQRIMHGKIPSPMKPGDHGPTPTANVEWPKQADLEALKARLRKPLDKE